MRRVLSGSEMPRHVPSLRIFPAINPTPRFNDIIFSISDNFSPLRQRWSVLFRDNNNTSDLRATLRSEQGENLCNDGLRSICWKAFLHFDNLDRTRWPQKISESRSAYGALKAHFMKYIEHPDDLQSTVDPLADDEEVRKLESTDIANWTCISDERMYSLLGKHYDRTSR